MNYIYKAHQKCILSLYPYSRDLFRKKMKSSFITEIQVGINETLD